MSPVGHIEEAATITVGLVRLADDCRLRVALLAGLVAAAVAETAAREPPSAGDLHRRDALGRLREALERIVDLEAQGRSVIDDLRAGMYSRVLVGSPERPVGYGPAQAAVALEAMAVLRAGYLQAMSKAVHALCQSTPTCPRRLSRSAASALRGELRALSGAEDRARAERLALIGLGFPLAEAV